MKKWCKRLILTFLICLLLGVVTASAETVAYPVTYGCVYFDPATGTITHCDRTITKAVLPSEIYGIPVVKIGSNAFEGCTSLTSVALPDSVKEISESAFFCCWSLTSVTIPDSVSTIGNSAFYNCSGLTSVTIPDSVSKISSSTFSGCSGLTDVTIPAGVTEIGNKAFYSCKSLTNVFVTDIGAWWKIRFNDEYSNPFYYAKNLYLDDTLVTELTIPTDATEIGSAFRGCTSLRHVTIPDSVTEISDYAFSGCIGLMSVTIPDSVTQIGDRAFSGCSGLASVTISASVTKIGDYAFSGCIGLTNMTIPAGVTEIGTYAFSGCSGLTSVTIPDSVTVLGGAVFSGCSSLTNVTLPDSVIVKGMGSHLFDGCSSLVSIAIPNNVPEIYSCVFRGCSSLTNVSIPQSVTTISHSAFSGCSHLTDVYYAGSKEQWGALSIGDGNAALHEAEIHFNSSAPKPKKIFTMGKDNLSFLNRPEYFFSTDELSTAAGSLWEEMTGLPSRTYQISAEAYLRLTRGMSKTVKQQIYSKMTSAWNGSCYGMTQVAGIRFVDPIRIPFSLLDDSLPTAGATYELTAPNQLDATEDLINYYQLSQGLPIRTVIEERVKDLITYDYETAVQEIIETLEQGHPVAIGMHRSWKSGGHSVLLIDMVEETDVYYVVKVYDPNFAEATNLYIYKTPGANRSVIRIAYSNGQTVNEAQLQWDELYRYYTSVDEMDLRNFFGMGDNADEVTDYDDYTKARLAVDSEADATFYAGNISLVYKNGVVETAENISGPYYYEGEIADETVGADMYFLFEFDDITTDEITLTVEPAADTHVEADLVLEDWSLTWQSEERVDVTLNNKDMSATLQTEDAGLLSAMLTQDILNESQTWYTTVVDAEDARTLTLSAESGGVQVTSDNLKGAKIATMSDDGIKAKELSTDENTVIVAENGSLLEAVSTNQSVKTVDITYSTGSDIDSFMIRADDGSILVLAGYNDQNQMLWSQSTVAGKEQIAFEADEQPHQLRLFVLDANTYAPLMEYHSITQR